MADASSSRASHLPFRKPAQNVVCILIWWKNGIEDLHDFSLSQTQAMRLRRRIPLNWKVGSFNASVSSNSESLKIS